MTDLRDALSALHGEILALAAQISAPADQLPAMDQGDGADSLWIGVRGTLTRPTYQFNYTERGVPHLLAASTDREQVLEAVFNTVTFAMAGQLESRQRRAGEDSRIQLFAIQEGLMRQLRPEWADRVQKRHAGHLGAGQKGWLKL